MSLTLATSMFDPHPVDYFPGLVDEQSFIDKGSFAIFGVRRKKSKELLYEMSNVPIGSNKSCYGRMIQGVSRLTRNPIQLKYSVWRSVAKTRKISPYRLIARSDFTPLTAADVIVSADSQMRRGYRARPSAIELTFDLTVPSQQLLRVLQTRAKQTTAIKGTYYVGSAKSPWQVRVYEKAPGVARLEFMLRSRFLGKSGITSVSDILRIRRIKIWKLVWFSDSEIRRRLLKMQRRLIW